MSTSGGGSEVRGSYRRTRYRPMVMKTTLFLETDSTLRLPALANVPATFLATEPATEPISAACDATCRHQ